MSVSTAQTSASRYDGAVAASRRAGNACRAAPRRRRARALPRARGRRRSRRLRRPAPQTASTTCGTSASVPTSGGSPDTSNVERWPARLGALGDHEVDARLCDAHGLVDGRHHRRRPARRGRRTGDGSPSANVSTGTPAAQAERDLLVDGDLGDLDLSRPRAADRAPPAAGRSPTGTASTSPPGSGLDEQEVDAERCAGRRPHGARSPASSTSSGDPAPASTPNAPAPDTAATSSGVVGPPAIGAWTSGCSTPRRRVSAVGRTD